MYEKKITKQKYELYSTRKLHESSKITNKQDQSYLFVHLAKH